MSNKNFVVKSSLACSNLNISAFEIWHVFFAPRCLLCLSFIPPFKNKQAQHGSKVVLLFAHLLPTSHSSLPSFLHVMEQVQFSLVLCHLPKVQERGILGGRRMAIL